MELSGWVMATIKAGPAFPVGRSICFDTEASSEKTARFNSWWIDGITGKSVLMTESDQNAT